jgi:hypothetical protein
MLAIALLQKATMQPAVSIEALLVVVVKPAMFHIEGLCSAYGSGWIPSLLMTMKFL